MDLRIQGIETDQFQRLRNGGTDAYGQVPLVRTAEGLANPCRHCLDLIAEGSQKLVLAFCPLPAQHQPYAETGPIFLHKSECARYDAATVPGWFAFLDPAAIRGYDADDWIRYDTGHIVSGKDIEATCRSILADPSIRYVHIRSKFGCFQTRVDRA